VEIRLVRHGESLANTGERHPHHEGDYLTPLSEKGHQQAIAAGARLGSADVKSSLIYTSPYVRSQETLDGILRGAGLERTDLTIREDPRLREMDIGYADLGEQQRLRIKHGWFFYRFSGGESPADCYDRVSGFLASLMRETQRQRADKVVIVTHGMALRCFVMRFMHLTVQEFESLKNPQNCEIVTIRDEPDAADSQFRMGRWSVSGLRFRNC